MAELDDKFYPTLGINVTSGVRAHGDGWRWKIEMHTVGPDDLLDRESATFNSKRDCTMDFLMQWIPVVNELLTELSS